MQKNKSRRSENSINAGSMADIAFLLLIFFLVTTTILSDEGLVVKLPPFEEEPIPEQLPQRNVFSVKINAENQLLVRGAQMQIDDLRGSTKNFVLNPGKSPRLAASPKKAVVSIQCDRSTEYKAYLEVYNELKAAYREMREARSQATFGTPFDQLSLAQQKTIQKEIPIIISEAEPFDVASL